MTNSPAIAAGLSFVTLTDRESASPISITLVRLIASLLIAFLAAAVACGDDDAGSSSGLVSVARISTGELVNGECRFDNELSEYPVDYSSVSEDCRQAVTIGPVSLTELEQMKQDVPSFWGKSSPYQQALVGERIGDECKFESPAVQAYLEFSTTASTDWANCIMIVDVGPVTEKQIDAVERLGSRSSSTAVPASPTPVPSQ